MPSSIEKALDILKALQSVEFDSPKQAVAFHRGKIEDHTQKLSQHSNKNSVWDKQATQAHKAAIPLHTKAANL